MARKVWVGFFAFCLALAIGVGSVQAADNARTYKLAQFHLAVDDIVPP